MNRLTQWVGGRLGRYLTRPIRTTSAGWPLDRAQLAAHVRAGDVLLIEGVSRVSSAIKYLTQSTWSHAALCVGDATGLHAPDGEPMCLIEADIVDGVRAVPLSTYAGWHGRICRPVGLAADDLARLCAFAVARLGEQYDLKNLADLARYLLPHPPVPSRFRRRMLALGSGDPTRAICSTLIAQAFESIRYPILPIIETVHRGDASRADCIDEILHVRNYSLFVPRDFDVSPYFDVVKPAIASGFDFHHLHWEGAATPAALASPEPAREQRTP